MKSLSVKLEIILFIIGLAIFSYAEVWGADWKYYGRSSGAYHYYDSASITRSPNNIVRVWVKLSYTEEGIIRFVSKYGSRYEKLNYALASWEFDCADKRHRVVSEIFYSEEGTVLTSTPTGTFPEWDSTPPDSMGDTLAEKVCK